MNTYQFFKENGGWHVRLPKGKKKGKEQSHVDMLDGADSMLNLLAEGKTEVTLTLNTEPFENAEVLELLSPCKPFLEGGYYLLREHDGKEINYEMWISDVTQFAFGDIPEKFYVKRGVAN
jgi:hypothetical protein